jgi:hypothetical protein
MSEVTPNDSFARGRSAFMEGQPLYLSLESDTDFASGWLDAFEEFMCPPKSGRRGQAGGSQ